MKRSTILTGSILAIAALGGYWLATRPAELTVQQVSIDVPALAASVASGRFP
ncbi:hypothetical protein HLB44_22755 [Aquincola sp. S2]|uniref:Efflux RND transporter periplasmic adaptor subunit n=1 Tax=Pseudaquabacterium terrae TaxID=2732868 RepID=A0ABX2EMF1_9BURK|nr:hypothetical protein [Aquabacterium terrae]NRF69831.1 hypothetical protein [Aquabacterium terrae]